MKIFPTFKSIFRLIYRLVLPFFNFFIQKFEEPLLSRKLASYGWSIDTCKNHEPGVELTVFIPVASKDTALVRDCVYSLRDLLNHRIYEIVVCGSSNIELKETCKIIDCRYIDEVEIAPVRKSDINFQYRGSDRSGWIFQQLVKLNVFSWAGTDHVLIWDVDTVLLQRANFEIDGDLIVEFEKHKHQPYFDNALKLLGELPEVPVGLTCHKVLFKKEILQRMLDQIERRSGEVWHQAIINSVDSRQLSSISEYAMYSSFAMNQFPKKIKMRHWKNTSDFFPESKRRQWILSKLFFSVSYHNHA